MSSIGVIGSDSPTAAIYPRSDSTLESVIHSVFKIQKSFGIRVEPSILGTKYCEINKKICLISTTRITISRQKRLTKTQDFWMPSKDKVCSQTIPHISQYNRSLFVKLYLFNDNKTLSSLLAIKCSHLSLVKGSEPMFHNTNR